MAVETTSTRKTLPILDELTHDRPVQTNSASIAGVDASALRMN